MCLHMCVDAGKEYMRQSEDNLRKSVLSFSHVGPVDGPQAGRLGGRNPYLRNPAQVPLVTLYYSERLCLKTSLHCPSTMDLFLLRFGF